MGSGLHSKRKKKRSQKRGKKRTRSNKDKTKKPKRRHDSVSCSEEDSVSNSSVSCYSSEDDYRRKRRARSRDRKDRKDLKKRAKRSSSVSESSEDDSPRVKKRKRSKRSKDSKSRKKRPEKKRRRSLSVSSLSGRSKSHSSCERSDGTEREFVRKETKERKGREKGKERNASRRREKGKERSVSKRKRRSKSCSPCSLQSERHRCGSEDRMVEENNPKRLKSVIVVAHEKEAEIRESNWDGNKAEIVFEHDEYPSRSNDSNDGVIRREASSFSHDVSSGKPRSLYDTKREIVPSDVQTSEVPESQRIVKEKTGGINLNKFGSGENDQLKENKVVSNDTAGSNCDDLAAVLRQKALENFLKRQVKSSIKNAADKKGDLNCESNSSSPLKTDQVPHTSNEHSGFKSVQMLEKADVLSSVKGNHASFSRRDPGINHLGDKYTAPRGFADSKTKLGLSSPRKEFIGARNTWRRQLVSQESSLPNRAQSTGKDSKLKMVSEDSSQSNLSPPKKPIDKDSKQQFTSQEVSQPNLSISNKPLDRDSKRHFTSQEVSQPNLLTPEIPVDRDSKRQFTSPIDRDAEQQFASPEVSHPNLSVPKDAVNLGSSRGSGSACLESTVSSEKVDGDAASQPSANETDGDSQFQQKTMSVMRGGEMVQVSYKVYIPKKAPTLARRQLKR